jgi:hypothetical protein
LTEKASNKEMMNILSTCSYCHHTSSTIIDEVFRKLGTATSLVSLPLEHRALGIVIIC